MCSGTLDGTKSILSNMDKVHLVFSSVNQGWTLSGKASHLGFLTINFIIVRLDDTLESQVSI